MDIKSASEAVGLLGTLKEVKDKFTGKSEIKDLQAQLAEKNERLKAAHVGFDTLGLSSEQLAIIAISAVAIVAIIAVAMVVAKCQPSMST